MHDYATGRGDCWCEFEWKAHPPLRVRLGLQAWACVDLRSAPDTARIRADRLTLRAPARAQAPGLGGVPYTSSWHLVMGVESVGAQSLAYIADDSSRPIRAKSPLTVSVATAHAPECLAWRTHLNRKLGLRPLCRELHRRSQWRSPHASLTPSSALRGPIGSSTESPSGAARMRFPHPAQRFVAP